MILIRRMWGDFEFFKACGFIVVDNLRFNRISKQ